MTLLRPYVLLTQTLNLKCPLFRCVLLEESEFLTQLISRLFMVELCNTGPRFASTPPLHCPTAIRQSEQFATVVVTDSFSKIYM